MRVSAVKNGWASGVLHCDGEEQLMRNPITETTKSFLKLGNFADQADQDIICGRGRQDLAFYPFR